MLLQAAFVMKHTYITKDRVLSIQGLRARNGPFTKIKRTGNYYNAVDANGMKRSFLRSRWRKCMEMA